MTTILENIAQLEKSWAQPKTAPRKQRSNAHKSIQTKINVRIKKELEFPNLRSTDKADLATTFTTDFEKIQNHVDQWFEFAAELQRTSFFFKNTRLLSADQNEEIMNGINQIFANALSFELTDNKVLVDELFNLEFDDMRLKLGTELDNAVASFVKNVFNKLDELRQRNILGTIYWAAQDSCHFVDWQHEIIAEKKETGVLEQRNFTVDSGSTIDVINERTIGTNTTAVHMATRREQHLMKTKRTRLSEFKLKIPSQFTPLLSKIPTIFKPDIRVVSGEAFRNEKTEQCFGEKSWLGTRVERQVVERLRVAFDPAVILGDTVLFAWDDEDSAKDEQKQDSLVHLIWALSCGASAITFSLLLANQNLITRFLLVSPLFAGGVWLAMSSYKGHQVKLRKQIRDELTAAVGGGYLAVMLGLCIGVSGLAASSILSLIISVGIIGAGTWAISTSLRSNGRAE